jgi:hypothetical protein
MHYIVARAAAVVGAVAVAAAAVVAAAVWYHEHQAPALTTVSQRLSKSSGSSNDRYGEERERLRSGALI